MYGFLKILMSYICITYNLWKEDNLNQLEPTACLDISCMLVNLSSVDILFILSFSTRLSYSVSNYIFNYFS